MSESQTGYGDRGIVVEGSYKRCAAALRLLHRMMDTGSYTPAQICIMHDIERELIKGAGPAADECRDRLERYTAEAAEYIQIAMAKNKELEKHQTTVAIRNFNSVLRVIANYLEAGMGVDG